ncbi:MAG: class I SAM-dependent methyltransferase [Methanobacteriota archaeon]
MSRGHHHAHNTSHDWDADAGRYDDRIDAIEPELSKATAVLLSAAHVRPTNKVLDLACGPGHTTAAATAAGALATGVDSSPEMIRRAKNRFPDSQFHLGNMLAPPAGPWDAVLCRLGGHHADPVWIRQAVKVLEAGGRLAIAEADALDEDARAKGMRSPREWVQIMQNAGLEDVQVLPSEANFDNIPASLWQGQGHDRDHSPRRGPVYVIVGKKPLPC